MMRPLLGSTSALGPDLLQLIWEGTAVAVAVTLAFSLAVVGITRAGEAKESGRTIALAGWSLLGVLGLLGFVAAAVLAVHVVTNK
ncbi:unannotated protein [freshwater metagenome]|uniref:Unannotated protein n=1 Tax=freshwater metagenome TaxID=449393 RepID=A0A6J7IGG7_9ZZZZ|nr:hypothetical protein [Actinomycetota bacterium]